MRIGIWGAGTLTERGVLPALSVPNDVVVPETGIGWARRPAAEGDIRYQAAFTPEVVALCDEDEARLSRTAHNWRIASRYHDPRALLREMTPDVLLVVPEAGKLSQVPPFLRWVAAHYPALHVWVAGLPAPNAAEAARLAQDLGPGRLGERAAHFYFADVLSHAFAVRTARYAVEANEVGPVSALALRWASSFPTERVPDAVNRFSGAYAALELLLRAAQWRPTARDQSTFFGYGSDFMILGEDNLDSALARPLSVVAHTHENTTNVWLRCKNGVSVTALFAGADTWSAALPRLEVVGTQGRYLICEGTRRTSLHVPGRTAQVHESPAATLTVTAPELAGVAAELRAFLGRWAQGAGGVRGSAPTPVPRDEVERWMLAPARVLRLLEATQHALRSGEMISLEGAEPPPQVTPLPTPLALLASTKRDAPHPDSAALAESGVAAPSSGASNAPLESRGMKEAAVLAPDSAPQQAAPTLAARPIEDEPRSRPPRNTPPLEPPDATSLKLPW